MCIGTQTSTHADGSLQHAEVEICGRCYPSLPSSRYFAGPAFIPDDYTAIRIVRTAPKCLFDLPQLTTISSASPERIASRGLHTLRGVVVATWGQNNLILRDNLPTYVNCHHVELSMGTPLPEVGSEILAVGRPAADTYRLNLSGATYKKTAQTAAAPLVTMR